jgi:hypothetical protein
MITLKPSHEYHISFSLVNADPESRVVTWDFESINESTLLAHRSVRSDVLIGFIYHRVLEANSRSICTSWQVHR